MRHSKSKRPMRLAGMTIALTVTLVIGACHNSSSSSSTTTVPSPSGKVLTTWGQAVAGAVVYLVPTDAVPKTPITSADVLSGAADAYDEPLEDAVASAGAAAFPKATTGSDGAFTITGADSTKSYFPFVKVAGATVGGSAADLYPGGTLSRVARTGDALSKMEIEVTGHPSSSATYVGSSTCLTCHSDYASQKTHAHRLGFRAPGQSTALMSLVRKPDFDDGLTFFKDATTANFKTNGTSLWYHAYDGSRGFDKFQIASSDPTGAEIRIYLWKDTATDKYKITMENLVTLTDPDRTFEVDLTYGGALYKQRYMLQVAGTAYKGRYPFLQYQHAGDDTYYDRTRKVWRDYHMDFFWDATGKLFKNPDKLKNIESNCMACHTTGYRYFTDPMTNERLCDGVNDPAGALDIDNDTFPDELNTGCEVCHGPGSEHVAAPSPRAIVSPKALSPSRESQICGRCHDRVAGNDDRRNDQPLNAAGEMAPPGTSRAVFLNEYTSRKGPKLSSFWDDQFHSKSHHQQYPDFMKSAHYRNGRQLVTCSDCHDLHGMGAFDGQFKANPADGSLCVKCHVVDINDHMLAKTGSVKSGQSTNCTSCHYAKVAKTGAGRRGLLLGTPTGGAGDANITYWQNDISSHHTVIPKKTNIGVAGKTPGSAMPIPYVNSCATCHDARNLKFSSPSGNK